MPTYRGRGPVGAADDGVPVGLGLGVREEVAASFRADSDAEPGDDSSGDEPQPARPDAAAAPARAPTKRRLLQPSSAPAISTHPG